MDTNNILQSLANLRDSLQAVESAKQQVSNNVAAYDKVRQQLVDTATLINQILSDFTSLSSSLNASQQAVETEIEASNKKILAVLNDKAISIAEESKVLVETVKNTTESIKAQLDTTVRDAIERINLATLSSGDDIKSGLQDIQSNFDKTMQSSVSAMQVEVNKFTKVLEKTQNKFDTNLNSELSSLSTAVTGHLTEMSSMVQRLSSQIDVLKKENERFERNVSSIGNIVATKLDEMLPKIGQWIDELKAQASEVRTEISAQKIALTSEIQNGAADIKGEITAASKAAKEDLKGSHEATKKRLEKMDSKLSGEIESMKQQIQTLGEQNDKNKKFIIAGIIVVLIPLMLMMLRYFKFV